MELYNIETDPIEKNNILDDENSLEILADLRQWSMQLVKEMVSGSLELVSGIHFII